MQFQLTKIIKNKEEFIRLLGYKSNIIRDNKTTLIEKYNSKELYKQFLVDTLRVLEVEKPFFLLDDSYKDKVLDVINVYRFMFKDKELLALANKIISEINGLNFTPETENDIIDEFICGHEDIRELEFTDLNDFINTIAQDIDVFLALVAGDLSMIDDVMFIGTTNYFLAAQPEIYQDINILEVSKQRAIEIKNKSKLKDYKTKQGAIRTLSYLQESKKNQE